MRPTCAEDDDDPSLVGPVGAISSLVVAAGLGFLGLRRTKLAGLLLVILSLGTVGILLVGTAGAGPDRPPLSAILTDPAASVSYRSFVSACCSWSRASSCTGDALTSYR